MAYPYQQMKDPQAAKAEPELPSMDSPAPQTVVLQPQPQAPAYPAMGQPYQPQPQTPTMGQPYQPQPQTPTMGQPYQQPGTPMMGQPYQPQPMTPTMGQPQQYQTMGYPAAQPYVQGPYAQPAQVYAQPVVQPVIQQQQQHNAIQCVICTAHIVGVYYRCVGCKNNGRPGGYHLCPTCHSRQKVKEKGLFDEFTQELGQLTYNSTSQRPHERWHPYEQMNTAVAAPPTVLVATQVPGMVAPQIVAVAPVAAMAVAPGRIQLFISCKELQKQGFGFVYPDPSVSVSLNGKEIAHTEQLNQCCNPTFQRPIEVSNAEAKVTFTVYTAGTRHATVSLNMTELLRSPGQTWSKALEDPKTGYRLQSGTLVVKWMASQQAAAPAVAVAQPYPQGAQYPGQPVAVAQPYAQAPQYYAAPPTYSQ